MSTKLKHQDPKATAAGPALGSAGANVIPLSKCTAEGCSKRSDLMNLCNEHYDWFKFGLITKEGKRPSDFDKKFQAYKKARAA